MSNLIQTIGIQRFLKLVIFFTINALLASALYFYVMPEGQSSEKEFKAVKNEVIRLRNDISNIEIRLADLKENEKLYRRLLRRGFISDQDRIDIRNVIDDMRQRSGVRTLNYNIQPIEYVEHDHSYAMEYDLIKSDVVVNVTALLDLEILALQAMLNDEFPGQTVLKELKYERALPITEDNLVELNLDPEIHFMRGRLQFSWYSLSPKPSKEEGGI